MNVFEQAAENLMNALLCKEEDKEIIQRFLLDFAEHILRHSIPASGTTIEKFQGMTIRQIAEAIPDVQEVSA